MLIVHHTFSLIRDAKLLINLTVKKVVFILNKYFNLFGVKFQFIQVKSSE